MAKIAVIDDDPDIVDATRILLESRGYEVVSAGTVDESLELVDTENPDLIILDVMLDEPDDGFYLANKFRKKGFQKPIIMLTSVSRVLGYDFGKNEMVPIDDFVEKPVPPAELLDKVEHYLTQSHGG